MYREELLKTSNDPFGWLIALSRQGIPAGLGALEPYIHRLTHFQVKGPFTSTAFAPLFSLPAESFPALEYCSLHLNHPISGPILSVSSVSTAFTGSASLRYFFVVREYEDPRNDSPRPPVIDPQRFGLPWPNLSVAEPPYFGADAEDSSVS
jgi:hypothetical protein